MRTRKVLLLCESPRGAQWQLEPPTHGSLVLLGWRVPDQDIEGGVPDEVASLLARALTRVAIVTFWCCREPAASSEDRVRIVQAPGRGERSWAAFSRVPLWPGPSRFPSKVILVSTRRPDVAKTLFNDADFPWWGQGQVILLSSPAAPPPAIAWRTLQSLFEATQPVDLGALAAIGVAAIVRPGVDGAVAGIMASTEEFERRLLSSIESEAGGFGFDWLVVPEDAFAEELSV